MQTLSLKKIVAIKIVGYTNINLLGKRQTLKVYKSKASCKIAAIKFIVKAKAKATKQFVEDFANVLRGEALKAKFWAAKKMLRLYRWSFKNYCSLLTAIKNVRLFNNSVCYDLKINLV